MKKKRILTIVLVLGIIIGAGAFFTIDYIFGIYGEVVIEAGGQLTASDFLEHHLIEASFVPGESEFDLKIPGTYPVKIQAGIFKLNSKLIVEDTIVPVAQGRDLVIPYGQIVAASEMVCDILDATEVSVRFATEPDFSLLGDQKVTMIVSDLGQNETVVESLLTISPVVEYLSLELGSSKPNVQDFLVAACEANAPNLSTVDMSHVGVYPVIIEVAGKEFTSELRIEDTLAPMFTVSERFIYQGVTPEGEMFVDNGYDLSGTVIYSIEESIDTMQTGLYQVTVVGTDESGNATKQSTTMTVLEDTEPPVFYGLTDKVTYVGDSYSYRTGITVEDNSGVELTYDIEASAVNLSQEGTYTATYTARDFAGNETVASISIEVRTHEYSLEQVNALADEVLNKIITPSMTDYEKCNAIYTWIRQNVGYINHTDKDDYLKAAYEAFTRKQGDCYAYYAVSKVLLTQAGIENRDIEKIPSKSRHYWNLVNIGDGWYHFDTTPRTTGAEFFMLTDDQMMSYSNIHYGSHNYDPELYKDVEWGTTEYHDFNPNYRKPRPQAEEGAAGAPGDAGAGDTGAGDAPAAPPVEATP